MTQADYRTLKRAHERVTGVKSRGGQVPLKGALVPRHASRVTGVMLSGAEGDRCP